MGRNLDARSAGRLSGRFLARQLCLQLGGENFIPRQCPVKLLLLAIHDVAQFLDGPLQVCTLAFESLKTRVVDHLLRYAPGIQVTILERPLRRQAPRRPDLMGEPQ